MRVPLHAPRGPVFARFGHRWSAVHVWDAFRGRQLAALARVTASEYGRPAPGMAEARELLNKSKAGA
jgi:hypothetical protein